MEIFVVGHHSRSMAAVKEPGACFLASRIECFILPDSIEDFAQPPLYSLSQISPRATLRSYQYAFARSAHAAWLPRQAGLELQMSLRSMRSAGSLRLWAQ